MREFIEKLRNGNDLSAEEADAAISGMLEYADDNDIYDFLVLMNKKGITAAELLGSVNAMKKRAVLIKPNVNGILTDTCGTGGDCKGTGNISTLAAIVACSAGIPIAKHGNYSVSSKSGSANVLEALGYNINMSAESCQEMIEKKGFCFLFAPKFHDAMKRVAPVRKRIGEKTIFNQLGPLCNPANVQAQLTGVYEPSLCEKFCYVLKETGLEHALVVYGSGLDEISNIGKTIVYELNKGIITNYKIKPEDFGFRRYELKDILGGSPAENALEARAILNGQKGAKRDIIVLNAAAAIYLGQGTSSIWGGVIKAEEALDSGAALKKLSEIIEYSNLK